MKSDYVFDPDIYDGPLEDPDYDPAHKPVNGRVPDVVAKWGKKSQLRWFGRFWSWRTPLEFSDDDFWCSSEHHKGACCGSCQGEYEDGYLGGGVRSFGYCCCLDSRIKSA